jgi:hypothetical protein
VEGREEEEAVRGLEAGVFPAGLGKYDEGGDSVVVTLAYNGIVTLGRAQSKDR